MWAVSGGEAPVDGERAAHLAVIVAEDLALGSDQRDPGGLDFVDDGAVFLGVVDGHGKLADVVQCKSVRGSTILLLGVAYKRDIDDVRERPALDVISLLLEKGANVLYHDPYVPSVRIADIILTTQAYSSNLLEAVDAVVITTDHSNYQWQEVVDHAPLVIDSRNADSQYAWQEQRIHTLV